MTDIAWTASFPFLVDNLLCKHPSAIAAGARATEGRNPRDSEGTADAYHRRVANLALTVTQFRKEDEFGETTVKRYMANCEATERRLVDVHRKLLVQGVTAVLVKKIRAVADEVTAFGRVGFEETNVGWELMALANGEEVDEEEQDVDRYRCGSGLLYATPVQGMGR